MAKTRSSKPFPIPSPNPSLLREQFQPPRRHVRAAEVSLLARSIFIVVVVIKVARVAGSGVRVSEQGCGVFVVVAAGICIGAEVFAGTFIAKG